MRATELQGGATAFPGAVGRLLPEAGGGWRAGATTGREVRGRGARR